MKIDVPEWLRELSRELLTQDGALTAHPTCQVRARRYHPAHEDFDAEGWVQQYQAEPSEFHGFSCDEPEPETGCEVYPVWVEHYVVQTFLTRKAAERYIAENAHNLREPSVYVESAYRNHEMIQLRDWLLSLTEDDKP